MPCIHLALPLMFDSSSLLSFQFSGRFSSLEFMKNWQTFINKKICLIYIKYCMYNELWNCFPIPNMECIIQKHAQINPFIKNLVVTKNWDISATEKMCILSCYYISLCLINCEYTDKRPESVKTSIMLIHVRFTIF